MKLGKVAELVGARLAGDPDYEVSSVASLEDAGPSDVSFLADRKFLRHLKDTKAGAVVLHPSLADSSAAAGKNLLLADEPNPTFSRVAALFAPPPPTYEPGVHESAVVHPSAEVDPSAHVGPLCVVGEGARVGAGTVLTALVYLGPGVVVGGDCVLHPGVVVREHCRIGDRVVLHAGAVIGSDGFGYETVDGEHRKIPQTGNVVVEDDVEIGSCTCVDRARFASTVIGRGTKIDNLVQVAHNVVLGPGCLLAAQVGISGSGRFGKGVVAAGQVGVNPHVRVGDRAVLSGKSGITKDVPPGVIVSGFPPALHSEFLRREVAVKKLPALLDRVRELEERIAKLEGKHEDDS